MPTAREVMHENIVQCQTNSSAVACAAAMRDRDVGFIPIVDDNGQIAGTITDRDLCIRILAEGRSPSEPLSSVMERNVITCGPEDSIEQVEALMSQHKIRRIVVCDDSQHPIGVISLGDVVLSEPNAQRVHEVFESVHYPTPPEQPRL